MTLRDWIASKLPSEHGYRTNVSKVEYICVHGLRVHRNGLPPVDVYCAEPDAEHAFTTTCLSEALAEMPDAEFVVVVRRAVAADAYPAADKLQVGLGGLGTLRGALLLDDVPGYRSSNQEYVEARLRRNRHVTGLFRQGYEAYEIERENGLRSLVVVTLNPYEVTQEEAYSLLDEHSHVRVDALVTTNPNCRGISAATTRAAANAGTRILTLADFLSALGEEWTD